MHDWSIQKIQRELAELSKSGRGGRAVLDLILGKHSCAPVECDLLDYKRQANSDDIGIAEACRDIAAFYNMYGGYIVIGVAEKENESFEVFGAESGFDVEQLKNKLKDFTGERILISQDVCTAKLPSGESAQVFVLRVPARVSGTEPVAFQKDGPAKGSRGKRIFEKNEIPIREGDETTIAKGAKVVEIWHAKPHPVLAQNGASSLPTPLTRISHNLPDRNIICPHVIGRKGALDHLWRWLPDDLSHVKVLAGEGGIGKTSIAYEFADQVSLLTHQPFSQVVWLSAKERQFRPLTNSYDDMAETHFGSYEELLDRVCDFLAVTDSEREHASVQRKLRLIRQGLDVMPSLMVIDDIDSLDELEQKQALELGFLLSGTKTKILLTTRNNIIYSGDICYTVRGLEKEEFPDFFNALMIRFPLKPPRFPEPIRSRG